jgi:hypothetical protein
VTSNNPETRRDLLKEKTIEEIVSLWYTYNQLFKAANFLRHVSRGISLFTAVLGGILTYGLIWDGIENELMIALAVLISILTALRSALRPAEKQRELRTAANEYKNLCEEAKLILQIDFPNMELEADQIEEKVKNINKTRRELNTEHPDVSSVWYQYVKYFKSPNGLSEISVSETERTMVLGQDT